MKNNGFGWNVRMRHSWCRVLRLMLLGAGVFASETALAAQQPAVATHVSSDASHMAEELLSRRITIDLNHVSLKRAIDSVARVAQVFIEYQSPMLTAYGAPVTLRVTDASLGTVLERMLDGTTLRVIPGGRNRLTIVASPEEPSDSVPVGGAISGRVVDSVTGKGISGVTVKVAGTKLSGVTSDSGLFVLKNVPLGDQLLAARAFGYRPAERSVTVRERASSVVRITLATAPNVLSGVVTTATGQQRKIEVGNDITTLNADSLMKVAPIRSVTDLLENRVPGLVVQHTSGVPGDPARIRIRGAGSINENNDPILIVDGVRVYAAQSDARNASLAPSRLGGSSESLRGIGIQPKDFSAGRYATPSPLDQIDPNSIQTIEVLKGPSASAMYGADAANGVIVITTKHAQAGPTHWDARLGAGLSYMPGDWPANYYRFGYGPSSTVGSPFCAWNDRACTSDSVVAYQALNDPGYNMFADHGSDQSGSVTVSGGVPTLRYSLTASGTGNLGILQMPGIEQQRFLQQYSYAMPKWMLRPDKYNTVTGSGQLMATPSATATITVMSSLFSSTQQRSSLEGATAQLEGRYINPLLLGAGPLITGEYERATSANLTATNALTANWSPVSWLPLYATGGLNTMQRVDKTYIPYGIFVSQGGSSYDSTGSYGLGRGTTLDKTLTVGTTMPLPRISLGMGGNYHAGTTNDFAAYTHFLSPGISEPSTLPVDAGNNSTNPPTQSSADASTYGWYIEPRLNIASRFFVNPGFQLNGGSAYGSSGGFSGTGLTGFPKIDLSYVMVDRQDDPLWGVVSLLRPRVALGVAGTQPGPADKLRLFSSQATGTQSAVINLNGTLVPVAFLSSLGNTELQPERSRELESGFEADLWRSRLGVTYTRYDKVRHNAIQNIPVALSVGAEVSGYSVNIGEIQSTGTEVTINAQLLQSQAIGWNVNFNFSNRNEELVKLRPGQHAIFAGTGAVNGAITRLVEGYPLWGLWANPIVSYADADGDGMLEANEVRYGDSLVYLGPQEPKNTLGISTDVALFRGMLGVHASVAYQSGFTQYNQAAIVSGAVSQLGNAPGATLATQAGIIAATTGVSGVGFAQTVSVLRFQSLSVNYQVPASVSRHLRIPHLQVALQGSNLGLHTNYHGFDPNVNAYSTSGTSGDVSADSGQLPEPRTWSLSFTLGN